MCAWNQYENDGVCIVLYWHLYCSVFQLEWDRVGTIFWNYWHVLLYVFGFYLQVQVFHTYQIPFQYSTIPTVTGMYWHVNTVMYWRVLQCMPICILYSGPLGLLVACIVACIVVCHGVLNLYWIHTHLYWIHTQYHPSTCQYNWYVLNAYLLVSNRCWYMFNIYNKYTSWYVTQYMTIQRKHIGMYWSTLLFQ